MNNKTKRIILFIFGCITVRYVLTKLVLKEELKKILIIILAIISLGFMYIYLTGSRKVGPETMGEPIWWDYLRPVHSVLYGSAAIALINNKQQLSSNILLTDLIIGLVSFVLHHTT